MIRTALLGFMFCFTAFTLLGQPGPFPTVNHIYHTGTKTMSYSLNNAHSSWAAFYFFGDGNYTLQHNPVHEYEQAIIQDTEVFAARAYKPTLPSRINTIPTTGLSSAAQLLGTTGRYRFPVAPNPTTQQIQTVPVKIGTSWGAVSENSIIYVVSFMHPGTHSSPIDGSITVNFDPQTMFRTNIEPSPNSAAYNWVHDFMTTVDPMGNIDGVRWNFDDLSPGEIRHAYIEVEFPAGLADTRTPISVDMEWEDAIGFNSAHHDITVGVARNPRDPNFIEVDHDHITPYHNEEQRLEYEVGFYNDGTWYAQDVIVDVTIDVDESAGAVTAEYLESSFPCTMTLLSDDQIRFTFNNIFLPGINQDTTFTKDQCSGYLKFAVCTYVELEPEELILADALIYFDTLAPIYTGQDTTIVSYEAIPAPQCSDEQFGAFSNTGVGLMNEISEKLSTNAYPNPFTQHLVIPYQVMNDQGEDVNIQLYSIIGREQVTLFSGYQYKGVYNFTHDTSALPAGTYLLVIQNGNERTTQRLIKLANN